MHMRKINLAAIGIAALLALSPVGAMAQTAVQQSSTRLDAGQGVAVSTNYNTVNTQGVATITVPAGLYAYITRIELEAIQDATATAAVNSAFTSTNLGTGAAASPQWGFSLAATADATLFRDVNMAAPLKSQVPGTNVTITSPTAATHLAFGIKVYYYLAP